MSGKKSKSHTIDLALGVAPNLKAAAARLNVEVDDLKLSRDMGCDAFDPSGRVDCDKWIVWAKEHPEIVAKAGIINKAVEEALKIRAQRKMAEHKLDEAKRRVIPVDEVKRTYTRSVLGGKSKLLQSEKSITMKARMRAGLTDEQVAVLSEIVNEENREVAREMSKGAWMLQACPHCENPL